MTMPPPGYYPMQQQPRTSGAAVTSLVLGIASIFICGPLLGIPAAIVATTAKRDIRESGGAVGGDGLATGGLVTGIIGSVVWVIPFALIVAITFLGNSARSKLSQVGSSISVVWPFVGHLALRLI